MENNTKNTISYPFLPPGKKIEYVGIDDPYMLHAKEVARKSTDHAMPTGAVITCDGIIIAEASNKAALTNPTLIKLHKKYCIRRMCNIPTGKKYWACPGCASHENHGEYRAVLMALKKLPKEYDELDLYLWGHWWCCEPCWNKMFSIGIKRVFLLEKSEILFNNKEPGNIIGKQLTQ